MVSPDTKDNGKREFMTKQENEASRLIQWHYGFTMARANAFACDMGRYPDVVDAFIARIRTKRWGGALPEASGYTPERLEKEYGMSPLASAMYFCFMRDDPEGGLHGLKELK